MWTVAASSSSQFHYIQDVLYRKARQALDAVELVDGNDDVTEISIGVLYAQAWILLSIYEFTRVGYRCGVFSAGRSFRFVQLLRLHEIDRPESTLKIPLDFTEAESSRRTFWVAYMLDRFISIISGLPLTLNEHEVRVFFRERRGSSRDDDGCCGLRRYG